MAEHDFEGMDTEPKHEQETRIQPMPTTPSVLPTEAFGPQTLERAEEKRQIHEGLKLLAIRSTNPEDWIIMGDKPYPMDSACMKFANIYGVSFQSLQVESSYYNDERGPVIAFDVSVTAMFQNRFDSETNSAASSEVFFNGKDDQGRIKRLPLSEINRANVRKKAVTGAKARATRKILGLSFSRDEVFEAMRAAGKDPTRIQGITYGEGGKRSTATGRGTVNPTKKLIADMIYEMAGGNADLAGNMLEGYTEFTAKDGKVVKGKRSAKDLTDKHAEVVVKRVKKEYEAFKAEQERTNGNDTTGNNT